MSGGIPRRWLAVGLISLLTSVAVLAPTIAFAQESTSRKLKIEVKPAYPELARMMHVSGVVKIMATITPSGAVKSTRVVGGHPLLVESAVEAIKRCKFEPGPEETTQVVEFKFNPS